MGYIIYDYNTDVYTMTFQRLALCETHILYPIDMMKLARESCDVQFRQIVL